MAGEPAVRRGPGAEPGNVVADAVLAVAGRATLALQAARKDKSFGTAFWYNDLVEVLDGKETVRQYLVAAEPQTRFEIGAFALREGLITPELPADELVLPGFARKWAPVGQSGVAVMPTVDLHIHGERKGWTWAVQEITAGLAAQPADIEALPAEEDGDGDGEGLPAYLLGHEVGDPGARHPERPQVLLAGTVTRTAAGAVRWSGPLPQGCAGAPVFAGLPHEDGLKLICLGPVLADGPGDQTDVEAGATATVVGFDLLRPAIHTLSPERKRRWWQRG